MIAVAGYSLLTLWILIIGSTVADLFGVSSGYVAVVAFLIGVAFMFAVMEHAPEAGQ